jgi:replicative DNA helicase
MVDDEVFGSDGRPTVVTEVYKAMRDRDCFEVKFSDGTVIVADGDHEWVTWDKAARVAHSRGSVAAYLKRRERQEQARALRVQGLMYRQIGELLGTDIAGAHAVVTRDLRHIPAQPAVRTTIEIAESLLVSGGEANHSIPVAGALWRPNRELPLDPYYLGIWLGDGSSGNSQITTADQEIVDELRRRGFVVTKLTGKYLYSVQFPGVDKHSWKTKSVSATLRAVGLLDGKRIPWEYLDASEEQRRELLAGLIDSDGHIGHVVEISQKSEPLIRDVEQLLLSLGEKPSVNTSDAVLNGIVIGPRHRLTFTSAVNPARLSRKRNSWRGSPTAKATRRHIVAVRQVPSRPVRCIEVDADDHLFLAGERMVATHNSVGI